MRCQQEKSDRPRGEQQSTWDAQDGKDADDLYRKVVFVAEESVLRDPLEQRLSEFALIWMRRDC